jgi:hypothetical protein
VGRVQGSGFRKIWRRGGTEARAWKWQRRRKGFLLLVELRSAWLAAKRVSAGCRW